MPAKKKTSKAETTATAAPKAKAKKAATGAAKKKAAAKKKPAKKAATKKKAPAKKAATKKKAAAKKAPAKKAAKKTATKKAATKKAATKKAATKKTAAKKAPGKKAAAKETATKKAPAKAEKAAADDAAQAAPEPEKRTKATKGSDASTSDHDAILARIEAKAEAAGVPLAQGASAAAIKAAEKALGAKLPEEVVAFYRRHDGAEDDPAVEGRELLSLSRMVDEWKIWKDLFDQGTFEANDHGRPDPGVQQKWWIPEWVPVTYDGAGNHHVIDLDPADGGTRGQILSFWHDDDPRTVVAKDFLSWLESATWGDAESDDEKADDEKAGDDEKADDDEQADGKVNDEKAAADSDDADSDDDDSDDDESAADDDDDDDDDDDEP